MKYFFYLLVLSLGIGMSTSPLRATYHITEADVKKWLNYKALIKSNSATDILERPTLARAIQSLGKEAFIDRFKDKFSEKKLEGVYETASRYVTALPPIRTNDIEETTEKSDKERESLPPKQNPLPSPTTDKEGVSQKQNSLSSDATTDNKNIPWIMGIIVLAAVITGIV